MDRPEIVEIDEVGLQLRLLEASFARAPQRQVLDQAGHARSRVSAPAVHAVERAEAVDEALVQVELRLLGLLRGHAGIWAYVALAAGVQDVIVLERDVAAGPGAEGHLALGAHFESLLDHTIGQSCRCRCSDESAERCNNCVLHVCM